MNIFKRELWRLNEEENIFRKVEKKRFTGIELCLPVKSVIGTSNRMEFGLVNVTKP